MVTSAYEISKARPPQVRSLANDGILLLSISRPAAKGCARPTTRIRCKNARDGKYASVSWWLNPVTGKLDGSAAALVFDMMSTDVSGALDLWDYADARTLQSPECHTRMFNGVRCAKEYEITSRRMKSRIVKLSQSARLANPYCVWCNNIANQSLKPIEPLAAPASFSLSLYRKYFLSFYCAALAAFSGPAEKFGAAIIAGKKFFFGFNKRLRAQLFPYAGWRAEYFSCPPAPGNYRSYRRGN